MYMRYEEKQEIISTLKQTRLLLKLLKPDIKAEASLRQVDEQIEDINKTLEKLKAL